jgi:hypothetical protein
MTRGPTWLKWQDIYIKQWLKHSGLTIKVSDLNVSKSWRKNVFVESPHGSAVGLFDSPAQPLTTCFGCSRYFMSFKCFLRLFLVYKNIKLIFLYNLMNWF